MWSHRTERPSARVLRVAVDRGSNPLTFGEAMALWEHDADFRAFFFDLLAESPFSVYRWETPPLTSATTDRPFEFALIDRPGLARRPDPGAFEQQLRTAEPGPAIAFGNLGGDAVLVVPRPDGPADFCHLAAFQHEASDAHKHALWTMVGRQMQRRLGDDPVWLSTAGGGVPWLHVRLDDRPKYYSFEPFVRFP